VPKDTKFKPGQSGNPNGRPKGTGHISLLTILKKKLEEIPEGETLTYGELMIEKYVKETYASTDAISLRDMLDRTDGKPTQPIEHSGELEGRLVINRGKPRKTSD